MLENRVAQMSTSLLRLHEDLVALARATGRGDVVHTAVWQDPSLPSQRHSQVPFPDPVPMTAAPTGGVSATPASTLASPVSSRPWTAERSTPSPRTHEPFAPLLDAVSSYLRARGVADPPSVVVREHHGHVDDSCSILLPYALQCFHVREDWHQFVLFVVAGTTERCISYDEKPLLLLHRMRETMPEAVLQLRSVCELESPMIISQRKLVAKRKERSLSEPLKHEAMRLRAMPPDAPSQPGLRVCTVQAWLSTPHGAESLGTAHTVGPAADLPRGPVSYAVAIYPYESEREDEFDVHVGDTFIVLSKAKGWWALRRDSAADGRGDVWIADAAHGTVEVWTGWVPAGCLLETTRPLVDFMPPLQSPRPATESMLEYWYRMMMEVPIPLAVVVSTSTMATVLMDYETPDHSLQVRTGDRVRVFKRYNFWSYCILDGLRPVRGWLPSWIVSRRGGPMTPHNRSFSAGDGMARTTTSKWLPARVQMAPGTSHSIGP
ncbi:signal transduction protein [Malassezia pachydermatis]